VIKHHFVQNVVETVCKLNLFTHCNQFSSKYVDKFVIPASFKFRLFVFPSVHLKIVIATDWTLLQLLFVKPNVPLLYVNISLNNDLSFLFIIVWNPRNP
jgi:hypothetical protein